MIDATTRLYGAREARRRFSRVFAESDQDVDEATLPVASEPRKGSSQRIPEYVARADVAKALAVRMRDTTRSKINHCEEGLWHQRGSSAATGRPVPQNNASYDYTLRMGSGCSPVRQRVVRVKYTTGG